MNLQCDHMACVAQLGNQAQSECVHERHSGLTNLITFYDGVAACLADEGKAVVFYLDFRRAFDIVSHPQYSPGEAGSLWLGRIPSLLDKKRSKL